MKVIFLDIDGVLNSYATKPTAELSFGIHSILADRFNKLVERTGARVVLSSSWRKGTNWRDKMREGGLNCEFWDRTPSLPRRGGAEAMERGYEIQNWLEGHPEVTRYCILDDDSDMLPHQKHFKTSLFDGGLTEEMADQVAEFLLSPLEQKESI